MVKSKADLIAKGEIMELDIGDIVISQSGNMYSYAYNPYLCRFMYRKHGKNLEAIWFDLHEIQIARKEGNIYERLTTAST